MSTPILSAALLSISVSFYPTDKTAPEMIIGTGHDHTLDWWAFGVLMYEMLVGIPPFYNKNKHKMYHLIQESHIRYPDKEKHGIYISPDAQDLINKCLDKNKKSRLGQQGDVDEIMAHPFFKSLNVKDLLEKNIKPAFVPTLTGDGKDL